MKICKECGGIAEWNSYYGGITCTRCGYVEKPKPTHYSLLIRKTPEEMAEWIETIADCRNCALDCQLRENGSHANCRIHWLDWLNTEVNETEE